MKIKSYQTIQRKIQLLLQRTDKHHFHRMTQIIIENDLPHSSHYLFALILRLNKDIEIIIT